ncbi:hypothetical protein [Candidatus Nitrosocosmicus arcticus]|uniref:Uncharacterized protein n=1 Tax=Candidatus Nitrosocosmicus arcticus TaxID=2035267 RepID=A0A557SVX4_9ARCH|nr:hypothetical protein [Candidatus Nitrosocosmicus arcticus]TVP40756.1 exported protein of unknown function [Candidatus Nitrosocosmicus arcticus]
MLKFNTNYENIDNMKSTTLMVMLILIIPSSLIFSLSSFIVSPNQSALAACNETTDLNVVCNEQHNSRSNTYTTTTSSNTTTSNTVDSDEELESALCLDITCSLTDDYIQDYETDTEEGLPEVIDY